MLRENGYTSIPYVVFDACRARELWNCGTGRNHVQSRSGESWIHRWKSHLEVVPFPDLGLHVRVQIVLQPILTPTCNHSQVKCSLSL